jgi:hypothetical protein
MKICDCGIELKLPVSYSHGKYCYIICKKCNKKYYMTIDYLYNEKGELKKLKPAFDRKKYQREYKNKRLKEDLEFKLTSLIRSRIYKTVKNNKQSTKTIQLLGCTTKQLKQHLENQFDNNMNWDNYGTYWQIDHIIPCAKYNLKIEFEQTKCFNYRNLRPYEKKKNNIKNDKIDMGLIKQHNILDLMPI